MGGPPGQKKTPRRWLTAEGFPGYAPRCNRKHEVDYAPTSSPRQHHPQRSGLMANRNKQRGYELEAETVKHWTGLGASSGRVFASGAHKHALGEDYAGDLRLAGYVVEAKRKKSGYKFLYDSLAQDGADMLVIREDRARRLYVLEERTLEDLMRKAGLM